MSRGRFSFETLVIILLCATTCKANTNQNCNPSSCGGIQNISFPFRLKTDPEECGHPSYELECENNTHTILPLNSKRYYVLSISYESFTIRIVDPGIINNQCPSFPDLSLGYGNMPRAYANSRFDNGMDSLFSILNTPAIFVSCSSEVNSSLYVDTASCYTKRTSSNTSSSSLQEYSYVLLGHQVTVIDLKAHCKINMVAWFSSKSSIIDNTSFLSILDAVANGFSLPWYRVYCEECDQRSGYCYLEENNVVACRAQRKIIIGEIKIICLGVPWSLLPNFWWDEFFNEQVHKLVYSPYLGGQADLWWAIFAVVSKLTELSLLARFLCGLPILLILIVYTYRRRHLSNDETIEDFLQGQINLTPIRYKYTEIRKMTNKFKDKLGEGGYGSVYKGKLTSGILVAVKMMSKSKASEQEFVNEVATIGTIHHVNVVQLIGFCVEGSKRALVYEFMPNGSLEKYIFSQEEKSISLSYEKMFEISLGVARGIDYLHQGCEMQILHFDIKPHNILLDENFNPKISDFGLAKLYSAEDSIVSMTAARGTMGYMAPELFYKNIGGVSYKADVYSYGMLLMEMAGRRKTLNPFLENLSQIYFTSRTEDTSGEESEIVKRIIFVALWCIQMKPSDRPSMSKIVEMLEKEEQHLQMPPKPFQYQEESPIEDHGVDKNDNELSFVSSNTMDLTSLDQDETPFLSFQSV